jgi:hypothetical protein
MQRRTSRLIRTATAALLIGLAGAGMRAGSTSAESDPVATAGCHAWPQIFRPVLAQLSVSRIMIALPTYLPRSSQPVYAHVNVLNPPLTYDAVLSTRPGTGWPVPAGTELLAVHGSAGMTRLPARGYTKVVVTGRTIYLQSAPKETRSAIWRDRAAGITYTVTLPTRLGRSALLRVAGSLTTGRLRPAPITAGPGPSHFQACR